MTATVAGAQPVPSADGRAVLALPEGWVIDTSTTELMRRALALAGPSCAGVFASRGDIPAGSSYRVAAERQSLLEAVATPARAAAPDGVMPGAVLHRAGVSVEVDGDGIRCTEELLMDPRAVCFDPWRELGPVQVASRAGRPPFPRRPVVLLLGLEVDPDLADWARSVVNAFVRADTEGRLAVPEPTGGLHLTRPCLPSEATVAALRPDVVLALDARAGQVIDGWLGTDRSAIVIQLSEDTSDDVELVSWQIGRACGRLRARVGRGVQPEALAALTRRLCAGPQPLPPTDHRASATGLTVRLPSRRRKAERPSLQILLASTSPAARARFVGLVAQARAAGTNATLEVVSGDAAGPEEAADVVVLHGMSNRPGVEAMVARRSRAGRVTVLDLARSDLDTDGGAWVLHPPASALLAATGRATAPSARVVALARDAGARCLEFPTLLEPQRVTALGALADQATQGDLRLGWYLAPRPAGPSEADRAVADVVRSCLEAHQGLQVDLTGEVDRVADVLGGHPRVHREAGTPNTRLVRQWSAQIWTGSAGRVEIDGALLAIVEAHLLGVPTVVASGHPAVSDGLVPASLAVADRGMAAGWQVVGRLLDDPALRDRRSRQVRSLADGLYGPVAAQAAVDRLLGWAQFGERA